MYSRGKLGELILVKFLNDPHIDLVKKIVLRPNRSKYLKKKYRYG